MSKLKEKLMEEKLDESKMVMGSRLSNEEILENIKFLEKVTRSYKKDIDKVGMTDLGSDLGMIFNSLIDIKKENKKFIKELEGAIKYWENKIKQEN